jgi:hypothetical protein
MTEAPTVRASGPYAVFEGATYEVRGAIEDHTHILRWWGHGTPPAGFEMARFDKNRGSYLAIRKVDEADLERWYRLTVLCGYRGGGPFRVNAVGPDDGESPMLYTTYEGDDREWALAQPGCEPNQMPMGALEAREVWGHFRLDEVDFLRENIEDFRVKRRRRRAAKA